MEYALRKSARSKHLRISVKPGGTVIVSAPMRATPKLVESFVAKNAVWIDRAVKRMSAVKPLPVSGRRDYLRHREAARSYVTPIVSAWSARLGYAHGRISIKDTRRAWGSCSHRGNLNFSYKLLFLPRELAEYVVVHELCHLKEANHSPRFWSLVGAALPEYALRRRELRRYVLG